VQRRAEDVDRRVHTIRVGTVLLVWLCGLAAGFYGLLAAAARYGCGVHQTGLACRGSGSLIGILIVIVVIAVVTAVTIVVPNRPPRGVLIAGGAGLAALVLCLVAARSVLATA
jgi:hypothetical protein